MYSITCPAAVRKVADRYKDCVEFSFGAFCTLFALHVFGCRSLCDAVRTFGWAPSVSTLDRAVQGFEPTRFMRRLRSSVLRRYKDKFDSGELCFVVDDTLVKREGNNIFAKGYHSQHGKSGVVCAQRVMVLALVDKVRGVAVPLAFAMCFNKKDEGYVKAQDLCFHLVEEVVAAGFPALPTVADSGFDSMPLMKMFDEKGWTFVVECKSNRKVKRIPSPRAVWLSFKDALHKETKVSVKLGKTDRRKRKRKTKYVASRFVQLNGRSALVSACAVYNLPSDAKPFAFYASNDLSISGADLWEFSRARWHIEEAFRIVKQSFSFLKLPAQGKSAAMVSICIPFALLASVHTEPELWGGGPKETVGKIIGRLKQRATWTTIDEIMEGSKRPAILKLRSRRPHQDNRTKPVDPTADAWAAFRMSA